MVLDVPAKERPFVVDGNDNPQELQVGVRSRLDFLHRFQEVIGALQREIGGLNRHEKMRRGDQCIDRQQTESGRGVDEDVLVLGYDRFQPILHAKVAVNVAEHLALEFCEADT